MRMVPFDKQSVTVIRQSKVGVDTTYEPPLRVGFGISDKTVDLAHAVMGRTVLVPDAGPNPTHYHANNDVCWYIMSGGSGASRRAAIAASARRSSWRPAISS